VSDLLRDFEEEDLQGYESDQEESTPSLDKGKARAKPEEITEAADQSASDSEAAVVKEFSGPKSSDLPELARDLGLDSSLVQATIAASPQAPTSVPTAGDRSAAPTTRAVKTQLPRLAEGKAAPWAKKVLTPPVRENTAPNLTTLTQDVLARARNGQSPDRIAKDLKLDSSFVPLVQATIAANPKAPTSVDRSPSPTRAVKTQLPRLAKGKAAPWAKNMVVKPPVRENTAPNLTTLTLDVLARARNGQSPDRIAKDLGLDSSLVQATIATYPKAPTSVDRPPSPTRAVKTQLPRLAKGKAAPWAKTMVRNHPSVRENTGMGNRKGAISRLRAQQPASRIRGGPEK
jgi:hypothetical protein